MDKNSIVFLVLAALAGAALLFRRWYLRFPRSYIVSEQISGDKSLTVTEHNPRFETATIELSVKNLTAFSFMPETAVEFIDTKGEFTRFSLEALEITDVSNTISEDLKHFKCTFEKRDLMRGIRNREIKLNSFRFVALSGQKALIKSHVIAFSTKYMLFRPDSGKYN
ncbi:MAG: hypothetical protein CVT92_13390 [Bacteroidetes bacterium HGW-Bacteroidetes-1]|jgi:glutaredoxin-related protein|nr:MAG: hypothetical protein CVT92_13390 [Bacteroidetes bacterium HGW-Bacteroidetes-1]